MKIRGKSVWLAVVFFCLVLSQIGWAQDEKREKKAKKKGPAEIEAVITNVGQRTITFQVERKGKMREEVAGIDDQTYIEKIAREKITLRDLREGDKIYLRYEPDAYKPALSIQVVGKEELKKKSKKKGN